jgi:hypothetical protein
MKTIALRTTIAPDGSINLHVRLDLPPGEADVVVVVQPVPPATGESVGPPYPSDCGVWQGLRPDVDIDADLREMSRDWERGMKLPQ